LTLFESIGRYFWVLCLGITAINYVIGTRTQPHESRHSDALNDEASSLRLRLALGLALPWATMGVGILIGGVPNVWYFFRPQDGNPFVLGWFACLFLIALSFSYWVFIRGGAETIIRLRLYTVLGRAGSSQWTAGRIKFFAAFGPCWLAFCMYVMSRMNVPVPR
jgi:hypothetical protein